MSAISRVYTKLTMKVLSQHTCKHFRKFSASQQLSLLNCAQSRSSQQGTYNTHFVDLQLLHQNAWPSLSLYRTIKKQTSSRKEDEFKLKDAIPANYELIYKAPMDVYIAVAQSISTVSLLTFLGVGTSKLSSGTAVLFPASAELGVGNVIQSNEQMLILIAALLLANIGVQYIAFNYPLRIYCYNHKYISVFNGLLPFQTKKLQFKSGDVTQPRPKSLGTSLPWHGAKFLMGGRNVFILEDYFRRPADFTAMLNKEP